MAVVKRVTIKDGDGKEYLLFNEHMQEVPYTGNYVAIAKRSDIRNAIIRALQNKWQESVVTGRAQVVFYNTYIRGFKPDWNKATKYKGTLQFCTYVVETFNLFVGCRGFYKKDAIELLAWALGQQTRKVGKK